MDKKDVVLLVIIGLFAVYLLATFGYFIFIEKEIARYEGEIETKNLFLSNCKVVLNSYVEHKTYLNNLSAAFIGMGHRVNKCYTEEDDITTGFACVIPVDEISYLTYGHSMSPTILTGNRLLIFHTPNEFPFKKGHIIRFDYGNKSWVHRIINIDQDTGVITTKGDNNLEPEMIIRENITGLVVGVLYNNLDYVVFNNSE